MPEAQDQAQIEKMWREVLTAGHRHPLSRLPSSPRCVGCMIPFGGIGGTVSKVIGRKPSRKNPKFCNFCEDLMPIGWAEIDVSVTFADVRGSTSLGERLGQTAFAAQLNRFYKVATDIIIDNDGSIDKMVGDEVMALMYPVLTGPQHRRKTVQMAVEILRAVGYDAKGEAWLPRGIGIQSGLAFVGRIGTGGITDFTALGDTVNTAARLRDEAKAGEVVMGEGVYQEIAAQYPDLESRSVPLGG